VPRSLIARSALFAATSCLDLHFNHRTTPATGASLALARPRSLGIGCDTWMLEAASQLRLAVCAPAAGFQRRSVARTSRPGSTGTSKRFEIARERSPHAK
jgi:hypothetical protein